MEKLVFSLYITSILRFIMLLFFILIRIHQRNLNNLSLFLMKFIYEGKRIKIINKQLK